MDEAAGEGRLDAGPGSRTPQTAMSLAEELVLLRGQVKEQEKEIRRLKEEKSGFSRRHADNCIRGRMQRRLWANPHVLGASTETARRHPYSR